MSWKKILLIAIVAAGFGFASAPRSEAQVGVGIGIGAPIGFGYYGGYGCYPVGYSYGFGYAPYGYYTRGYARSVYRPYYWSHGRRVYYARRQYRHWR